MPQVLKSLAVFYILYTMRLNMAQCYQKAYIETQKYRTYTAIRGFWVWLKKEVNMMSCLSSIIVLWWSALSPLKSERWNFGIRCPPLDRLLLPSHACCMHPLRGNVNTGRSVLPCLTMVVSLDFDIQMFKYEHKFTRLCLHPDFGYFVNWTGQINNSSL